jgi:radical SAM protein with 4Fe4S-binding SPASM domain
VPPVKCVMITGLIIQENMHDLFTRVDDQVPVFKIRLGHQMVLYTPGFSIKTGEISSAELRSLFRNPAAIADLELRISIVGLLEKAKAVTKKWELQKQTPFTPECLILHAGRECNFRCTYCYAASDKTGNGNNIGFPGSEAIECVSRYIAEKVSRNSQKLTVAYHGSGEPTLHWDQLTIAFRNISRIAEQKKIRLFNYIATNGCLDEGKTDWLAEHMDLIGISCDGTPDIQSAQRKTGQIHYPPIEKVCERILDKGGKFDIRVTVTRDTVLRMPEITWYLIEKCRARNIRIEPVYLAGDNSFKEDDANSFFDQLTKSGEIARKHGIGFGYAGIRMAELHGTYCDVSRNTIRLTADGKTRNCFCFLSDKEEYITGVYNESQSSFSLRADIDEIKSKAYQIPEECHNCINVYHCSRGCPDYCLFENGYHEHRQLNPFRCRLHQLIAVDSAIATAITPNISN